MSRHLTTASCCAAGVLLLASTGNVNAAGGAFAVDDSEVGKPGECKVESWASFAGNKDFIGAIAPACVANLGRSVELGVQVQRARGDGEWGTGLTLKAKTNIIPLEGNRFGLGISGSTSWDLITGDNTGGTINVPLTFEVSEPFKINLNAGWLHEREGSVNWFTWGGGFEWAFMKPFTLIGEVFGQIGDLPADTPGSVRNPRAQVGLRYTPMDNLDIDVIYGRNITGEDSNWITAGLNVRF